MTADRLGLPVPDTLTVYGAAWCGDCRMVTRYLDGLRIPYRYLDLGMDRAAQAVLDAAGIRSIPVVVTAAGDVLIEPSGRDLVAAGIVPA